MDMGRTSVTYNADNLIAGEFPRVTALVTVLLGAGVLARGQLLGKITRALGAVTPNAGNTGNGTVTGAALGLNTASGTYTLTCITAAANAGTFRVEAPDGSALPDATVAVAYINPQLNLTINDGAVDFIVGDSFTVTVVAGSLKYLAYSAVNTDGSQEPVAVLAADIDATLADAPASVYMTGEFNKAKMTGYTASLADELRRKNIFAKTIV